MARNTTPRPTTLRRFPSEIQEVSSGLPRLAQSLRWLYQVMAFLDIPGSDRLLALVRRLYIQNLIGFGHVVGLFGRQSHGKTTLLRLLYPELDGLLPDECQRGETLPVFLREEHGLDGVRFFFRRIAGPNDETEASGGIVREPVPLDAVRERARHPHRGDLRIEIEVPVAHLGGGAAGILMFPGFENPDEAHEWDRLARFGSKVASASIVVIDPATLAEAETLELVETTVPELLAGRAVLLLTKSDTVSDCNEENRQKLIDASGIPATYAHRVICVGDCPELSGAWKPALKRALGGIVPPPSSVRVEQLAQLEHLVGRELNEILETIASERSDRVIDTMAERREIQRECSEFDASAVRVRGLLERRLKAALHGHLTRAETSLRTATRERSTWKKVGQWLFGANPDDVLAFDGALREAWSQEAGPLPITGVLEDVLAAVVADELHFSIGSDAGVGGRLLPYSAHTGGDANTGEGQVRSTSVFGLLVAEADGSDPRDHTSALRALPALALEHARVHGVASRMYAGGVEVVSETPVEFLEDVEKADRDLRRFFAVVCGGLLVDGAVDGRIDSLPNLLKALGFVGGGAGTTSATAGGAVTGSAGVAVAAAGLFAAVTAVHVVRTIHAREMEEFLSARSLLAGMAESTVIAVLEQFDELIARIRRALLENLERNLGLDAARGRMLRLDLAHADVRETRTLLLEAIRAERCLV